jgi:hypothetical protein
VAKLAPCPLATEALHSNPESNPLKTHKWEMCLMGEGGGVEGGNLDIN